MNAPAPQLPLDTAQDFQIQTCDAVQALFPVECLQYLDAPSAARCQDILWHGADFGVWRTPESLAPHIGSSTARIVNIRRRLAAYLPENIPVSPELNALLDEGVLYLTRLALLLRIGPAGMRGAATGRPLDVTTIAHRLYLSLSQFVARGIVRRLAAGVGSGPGFVSVLTFDDLREFQADKQLRIELNRIKALHDRALWPDAPPAMPTFKGKTTVVRGHVEIRPQDKKPVPFPPIPDDYMAQMGPRVLWLIRDLGPNLVHLLHTLPGMLGKRNKSNLPIKTRIRRYFEQNVWRNRHGDVLAAPAFELKHGTQAGHYKRTKRDRNDTHQWPPRNFWSIKRLAVILQRAHLWLAFLVLSSRHGEVLTLTRDCLYKGDDGQWYVNGLTFKPTRRLGGKIKESPPPKILVDALTQQARLVSASERLAQLLNDVQDLTDLYSDGTNLWASLGAGSNADPTQRLINASDALVDLAAAIGMDPKPGGKNIHPHRMRKTIARLAGIAIDGSQKVLMLLLGHQDITTTLSYMHSDPAFAKEIDDVTRELRILRAQGLITDMHTALHTPGSLSYGGHGGGGASVLSQGVRAYEDLLHRKGEEWGTDSARELAVLLTNNGESARLVAPHVICTLGPNEHGACSQKKGTIEVGKCQVICKNHIEEATGRRDTLRIIPILIQNVQQNMADGHWLSAENDKRQLEHELSRFEDIGVVWRRKPEVRAILEAVNG